MALAVSSTFGDVLRAGAYRRFWLSSLCLGVARWMDVVALGWLALQLTGSPFMVGLAAFARSVPMLALGPFTGIAADRMPQGRVLLVTQSIGAAASLALAVLFGLGRGSYWSLVALSTCFGAIWAMDFPARRTALFTLVGPGRVVAAVSLDTVSMQLAKMVGPVLAGLLLARHGPAVCFAAVAGCYLLGLALLLGLGRQDGRGSSRPRALGGGEPRRERPRGVEGRRGASRAPAHGGDERAPISVSADAAGLRPGGARQRAEGLGALVAANGLGALLGALAIASRGGFIPHRRLFATAVLVSPPLLAVLAVSHRRWVCLVMLLLMGVAESGFAAMQSTIVLLSTPEAMRGGAMGILSACIGTGPLGALWIGMLATGMGVAAAMAVSSLAALLLMLPVAVPLARRPARAARGRPPRGPARDPASLER